MREPSKRRAEWTDPVVGVGDVLMEDGVRGKRKRGGQVVVDANSKTEESGWRRLQASFLENHQKPDVDLLFSSAVA